MFKKPKDSDVTPLKEPIAGSWINAVNPNKKEISFLVDCGVPASFIKGCLDRSKRPQVDQEDEAKLIIFQIPDLVKGSLETSALGVVVTEKYVVTISKGENKAVKTFVNENKDFQTTNIRKFILQLFSSSVKSYLNYLDYINNTLDKFETNVAESLGNDEIIDLLNLQKALTYFKTAAYGNQRVLDKILMGKFVSFSERDENILEDIIIDNKQAIEMIDTYLAITANTMAAYGSIVGNNLNVMMKLLAVLSISMAIPTIIASLYGMNLALPLQSYSLAFWVISSFSVLLSLGSFYAFFKLKWV